MTSIRRRDLATIERSQGSPYAIRTRSNENRGQCGITGVDRIRNEANRAIHHGAVHATGVITGCRKRTTVGICGSVSVVMTRRTIRRKDRVESRSFGLSVCPKNSEAAFQRKAWRPSGSDSSCTAIAGTVSNIGNRSGVEFDALQSSRRENNTIVVVGVVRGSLAERDRVRSSIGQSTQPLVTSVRAKGTAHQSGACVDIVERVANANRIRVGPVLTPACRRRCIGWALIGWNRNRPRIIGWLVAVDARIPSGGAAGCEEKSTDCLTRADSIGQRGLLNKREQGNERAQSRVVVPVSSCWIRPRRGASASHWERLVCALIVHNS